MKFPAFYHTPLCQVVLVGITCFAAPGMYQAVSNLGAGGTQDITLSDTANGVHYAMFAISGLISGGICNLLGPALTLFFGTLGYVVYLGALWCHQTQGTRWFLIFGGAVQGITAGLLWSAQGEVMMSYPLEKDKGKMFGIFWAIFQFGTFIGSVIALAINIRSGKLTSVATSTYIVFIVIILCGVASSALILPPHKVIRGDGTIVKLKAPSSLIVELKAMLKLFTDWRMLALLPMFFASNYFYAYQGAINSARFDGPTRALNGTLEAAGAIIGGLLIGYIVLDGKRLSRRNRGYLGLAVVTSMTIIVWAVGLSWQLTFTRADVEPTNFINYRHSNYTGKGALFFFYYFTDSCYQALAYWTMSAMTNDPFKLARYAGYYKALQSAGAAGSFGMDATKTPFLNEIIGSWALTLASFPLAFLVIHSIKETNYNDEKMVYVSDIKSDDLTEAEIGGVNTDSKEKISIEENAKGQV